MRPGRHEVAHPQAANWRVPAKLAEIVLGTAFAGLALFFVVGALRLPPSFSSADVGPGVFPLIVASVTLVLALALVLRPFVGEPSEDVEIGRPWSVLGMAATLVLYVLAIPLVGVYPASIAFIALTMWCGGSRRPVFIAICAVGFVAFTYGCFGLLLQVPFP